MPSAFWLSYVSSHLIRFTLDEEGEQRLEPYYLVQSKAMKNTQSSTLTVNFEHIFEWDNQRDLVDPIISEFYRFSEFLNRALKEYMLEHFGKWAEFKEFYVAFSHIALERYTIK